MLQWIDRLGKRPRAIRQLVPLDFTRTLGLRGDGMDTLQNVASALVSTLAAPVGWTDDALGHRFQMLCRTRERLERLARDLEPHHPPAGAAATAEKSDSGWLAPGGVRAGGTVPKGDRRGFDRRQFFRTDSGRRAADRGLSSLSEPGARGSERSPGTSNPVHKEMQIPDAHFAEMREDMRMPLEPAPGHAPWPTTQSAPLVSSLAEQLDARPKPLAIKNYDDLNVHKIMDLLRRLEEVAEVPQLLAHERTHKNRKSLIDMMERLMTRGPQAFV